MQTFIKQPVIYFFSASKQLPEGQFLSSEKGNLVPNFYNSCSTTGTQQKVWKAGKEWNLTEMNISHCLFLLNQNRFLNEQYKKAN